KDWLVLTTRRHKISSNRKRDNGNADEIGIAVLVIGSEQLLGRLSRGSSVNASSRLLQQLSTAACSRRDKQRSFPVRARGSVPVSSLHVLIRDCYCTSLR